MKLTGPALALALLCSGVHAQNCGGTERWAVKDGTDPQALSIDLTAAQTIDIASLASLHQPHIPNDNTTRVVPDETHLYKVQAHLIKWKHETDSDYHLVLTDDTLSYPDGPSAQPTGHSLIGEIPDPNCFGGANGSFGTSSPFSGGITSARAAMDQQFPNADQTGAWNDAGGTLVEITGIGFFDKPHGQTGRASNNLEIHPVLSISFNPAPPSPTVSTPTPTPAPTPAPPTIPNPSGPTAGQWEYQMITANNASDLNNQANAQGALGWEMVSVVLDTSRPDKYVGYLKRRK